MKPKLQSRNFATCLNVDDMEDSDVLLKFQNIEFRKKKNQLSYFPIIYHVSCLRHLCW